MKGVGGILACGFEDFNKCSCSRVEATNLLRTYIYMYIYIYKRIHTYINTHTHTYVYVYVYIYIYIWYICMYRYILRLPQTNNEAIQVSYKEQIRGWFWRLKQSSMASSVQAWNGYLGWKPTYAPQATRNACCFHAFPESAGIGSRIPFRKQAKLRVLAAVHLFVLLGESIDFNLLRFYLLLQTEVVDSTAIGRVQDQHCKDYAHVERDEYHGQEQQTAVEDGGCRAQLFGCRPAACMEPHLRAERRDGRIRLRLRRNPRLRCEAN